MAALRDSLENVLLVDAGDFIQGTAYGSMDSGKTMLELMNAADYDLATLGNHEFDYGMSGCLSAVEWADFPCVSCNFYEIDPVTGDPVADVLPDTAVFDVAGRKVAFIGITTPDAEVQAIEDAWIAEIEAELGTVIGSIDDVLDNYDADGNWWWTANDGVTFPIEIEFELQEAGGYLGGYLVHELSCTNERDDYAQLSDEAFANLRLVSTTGMGESVLFRSSSPINPELGRNSYADAAIEAAGVRTIVNLADSAEEAAAYEGFADSYYAAQNVVYIALGVDFQAEDFKTGLAEGLRFMAENEGPYLVHCNEGKDRAGFVSALLECFMGASCDEVVADYMVSYYNYYGVEPDTEKYTAIAESNIILSLCRAFDVEELASADLKSEASDYMKSIGLTDAQLDQLAANLGG